MARIGILSDTHGYLDPALQHHFAGCDEIWHAGDIGQGSVEILETLRRCAPLRAVHGNIDDAETRTQCPADLRFQTAGFDVWITHIAGRPTRYDRRIAGALRESSPHILVAGHSHLLQVFRDRDRNGMLFINPGAAGRSGPHLVRTAMLLTLGEGRVARAQAIELGPRVSPVRRRPAP